MLPDFPTIKDALLMQAKAYIEHLVKQEPVLREIRQVQHFEGSEMLTQPELGAPQVGAYDHFTSSKVFVSRDTIIEQGPAAWFEQLKTLAEELKAHQVRTMLERVGDAAAAVGNTVSAGGQPYRPDLFLEMLEKITIPFDDQGNPQMPICVVSPETAAHIRAHAQEWEADPEFRQRHAKILQRKREEWDDRESNRQLVD
jgi:hypothetical protein